MASGLHTSAKTEQPSTYMTIFEIELNGKRRASAGLQGSGVVTAILSLVRRRKATRFSEQIVLSASGLAKEPEGAKKHVEWFTKRLNHGDEVRIRVRTAPVCDPPRERPQGSRPVRAAAASASSQPIQQPPARKKVKP